VSEKIPLQPKGELLELCPLVKEMERRVAKQSPFYFAKYIMGDSQRRNGKLWGWNRHHLNASKLMWWAYRTRHERPWGTLVYLEWCRGSRKSTLIQATACCYLLDDQNLTCLLDGDISSKAAQKTGVIRNMFEDPYVIELWGSLKSKTKWKQEEWTLVRTVNTADASMKASGLDASKTGGHFDIIIPDDLQSDENCENPDINESVKTEFRMFETLKSGKTGTVTIMGGTRWGFRDLGKEVEEMEADERRRGVTKSIYISRLAAYVRDKNGKSMGEYPNFPEGGLDNESLKRMKIKMKPMLFSFNMLLEPLSDQDALIQKSWIRHHNKTLEDFGPDTRWYLAVDPAGEGKFKGADFNALVLVAVTTASEIFVMEVINEHCDKTQLYNHIVRLSEAYPLTGVIVETYFQQYQLASWLKNKAMKAVISIPWMKFKPSKKSKEQRIAALQPFIQSHSIQWKADHVDLEDQALQYPRSEHDDILDALSSALIHAAVPQGRNDAEPYYMNPAWKDEGAFIPTAKQPEPPSDLAVAVARAAYEKKMGRTTMVSRRFSAPSFRRNK
jgi:predicted phage terminase large subunit-like protein